MTADSDALARALAVARLAEADARAREREARRLVVKLEREQAAAVRAWVERELRRARA